jgi:hypothetical protein
MTWKQTLPGRIRASDRPCSSGQPANHCVPSPHDDGPWTQRRHKFHHHLAQPPRARNGYDPRQGTTQGGSIQSAAKPAEKCPNPRIWVPRVQGCGWPVSGLTLAFGARAEPFHARLDRFCVVPHCAACLARVDAPLAKTKEWAPKRERKKKRGRPGL